MPTDAIVIRGARQHNLRDIDLTIPRNRLVVITGLSGSGKSTLAFDTLYAEGQRRYVESLSTYARQFLERMEKPDVDLIEGLSPAIAIEQKSAAHNPRSTVGTVTEIYDYLRLLYARIGQPHCHRCGRPIVAASLDEMVNRLATLPEGSRLTILAPLAAAGPDEVPKLLQRLRKDGFIRVQIAGRLLDLDECAALARKHPGDIAVVIDRLVVRDGTANRLADSLELALGLSDGRVRIQPRDTAAPIEFNERAACPVCGVSYPPFTPAGFSFNSPQGACPGCGGLGTVSRFDPARIVPNPGLSLREGAVAPWAGRNSVHFVEFLDALTAHYGVDIHTPWTDLPSRFKRHFMHGSGADEITFYFEQDGRRHTYTKPFEGLIPNLERRYRETDSAGAREEIQRYMAFQPCPDCNGAKLNPAARAVTLAGRSIAETTALTVAEAVEHFHALDLNARQGLIAARILKEIHDRLTFLADVGLGYLTLDRPAATLSGGEGQRIRLATQIGSRLTGVLYVLDEPSVGLHQRDHRRLLQALKQMRDLGNTVLVVEHDPETIQASDYIVDMGPGAGTEGGRVVFAGSPQDLMHDDASLTGQYLSGRRRIPLPRRRRPAGEAALTLTSAATNNLKRIDVRFPLGCFVGVTGVSGSGKSSLVLDTLYPSLAQHLYRAHATAGVHGGLEGLDQVDKVVNIDQTPIGRTPRSNPATYVGLFAPIRDLFARTREARMRGFRPGRFSFNVKGGRCEACAGDGIVKIEMHFLPDVYVPCEVCRGQRYNRETLEIRYKGRNIAEVLAMTVEQARVFFQRIGALRTKLETLVDVGLGYIQLGQPATTLSGGEAQRIKLARELSKRGTGRTVYILDEPTTGLHMDDVRRLLEVLNRLVDGGNTVIVIEHNLDVIKTADHLIDLGPEGGADGGRVVGCGTPEELAANPASHTGRYLRRVLYGNDE